MNFSSTSAEAIPFFVVKKDEFSKEKEQIAAIEKRLTL